MSAWLLALLACSPLERGESAWHQGDMQAVVDAWGDQTLDVEQQQRLARALLKLERPGDAIAIIQQVPLEQRSAHGHLVAGAVLAHDGELPAALAAFEAGMLLEPLPALAVNRCTARLALDDAPLIACRRAAELAPEDPASLLGLADAAARQGSTAAAREALYAAGKRLHQEPQLTGWATEIWAAIGEPGEACRLGVAGGVEGLRLARSCAAAGSPHHALRLAEAASSGDQATEAIPLLLALTVDEAGRTSPGPGRQLAVARAERWARLLQDPTDAATLTTLGQLARLNEDTRAAEDWWSRALSATPSALDARLGLVGLAEQRGDVESALQLLRTAPEATGPEQLRLLSAEAALLADAGRQPEADLLVDEALQRCKALADAACVADLSYGLAVQAADQGQLDAALGLLEQAVLAGGPWWADRASLEPALGPVRQLPSYHQITGLQGD